MPAVRIADTSDAETVAGLLVEFRDWIGRAEPPAQSVLRSVRRLMADPDAEYLLGGNPVQGVCQLRYRHSVWTGSDDCELEDLFVQEAARGSGLGRALVDAALERARARGCGRILLDTGESNGPALALYRSFGFDGAEVKLRRPL